MIVKMQTYEVKDAILKSARKQREFIFRDMHVKIFPDVTPETARKRALFKDLRTRLHKAGVRHGLLFPAITYNGQMRLFKDCGEAKKYYTMEICPGLKLDKN